MNQCMALPVAVRKKVHIQLTFPLFNGTFNSGLSAAMGLPARDICTAFTDSPGFFRLMVAGVNGNLQKEL